VYANVESYTQHSFTSKFRSGEGDSWIFRFAIKQHGKSSNIRFLIFSRFQKPYPYIMMKVSNTLDRASLVLKFKIVFNQKMLAITLLTCLYATRVSTKCR